MILNSETAHLLRDGMQLAYPWAVRLLRKIVELSEKEARLEWENAWQMANANQRKNLANALLMTLAEHPETFNVLGGKTTPAYFADLFAQVQAHKSEVDEYVHARPELMKRLYDLRGKTLAINYNADSIEPLQNLLFEIEESIKAFHHQDQRLELVELKIGTQEGIGDCYQQNRQKEAAVTAYQNAIATAQSHSFWEEADKIRLKLVSIYRKGALNINEALKHILPIWLERTKAHPTLNLALISGELTELYFEAHDHLETKRFYNRTIGFLNQLKYEWQEGQSLPELIHQWLLIAKTSTDHETTFSYTFQNVLYLHYRMLRIRHEMLTDEMDVALMNSKEADFKVVMNEIKRIGDDQALLDNQFSLALFPEAGMQTQTQQNQSPTNLKELIQLDNRIVAYYKRLEEEGPSDDLLSSIEQEFSFAEQLTDVEKKLLDLYWLASSILGQQHKVEKAVVYLEKAYHLAKSKGFVKEALFSLSELLGYGSIQDPKLVKRYALEGIELTEMMRSQIKTPYQQSAFLKDYAHFYYLAIFFSGKLEAYEDCVRFAELLKSRNILSAIKSATRIKQPGFVEEIRSLSKEMDQVDEATSAKLSQQRQQMWDNWLLNEASIYEDWRDIPLDLVSQIQEKLSSDAAILNYVLMNSHFLFIMVITKEGFKVLSEKDEKGAFLDDVDQLDFSAYMDSNYRMRACGGMGRSPLQKSLHYQGVLERLKTVLLPEEVANMLEGKQKIYISPHRKLHRLPFHALPFEGKYLIEHFAISYLPNLSVLLQDLPINPSNKVLLVGSSVYDSRSNISLPPIPNAEEEIMAIANYYQERQIGTHCLLGPESTEDSLLSFFDSIDKEGGHATPAMLHFALHGEDAPENSPLDARLFLQKGSLDSFDISIWNLNAELVILSCCFGGNRPTKGRGMDALPGDDLFGLQYAFFNAGSKRVLGALWPVDDYTGKILMVDFHQKLEYHDPATSWQKTVADYLSNCPEEKRHPVYWATFFLSGVVL